MSLINKIRRNSVRGDSSSNWVQSYFFNIIFNNTNCTYSLESLLTWGVTSTLSTRHFEYGNCIHCVQKFETVTHSILFLESWNLFSWILPGLSYFNCSISNFTYLYIKRLFCNIFHWGFCLKQSCIELCYRTTFWYRVCNVIFPTKTKLRISSSFQIAKGKHYWQIIQMHHWILLYSRILERRLGITKSRTRKVSIRFINYNRLTSGNFFWHKLLDSHTFFNTLTYLVL